MFTALIIDDEEPVRVAIKILADWKTHNISTILEADNGEVALSLLVNEHVDIVFVDMKMPVMDGADFLKNVRKKYPNTKYIVVSGYADFEYTKESIKSKVIDYLLKPISKSELNRVISLAVDELKSENRKKMEEVTKKILIIEDNTYNPIHNFNESLIAPMQKSAFGAILIGIDNFDDVLKQKFEGNVLSMEYAITNAINQLCSPWSKSFSFRSSKAKNEIILVIEVNMTEDNNIKNLVHCHIKKIVENLKDLFGVNCYVAIGDFHEGINSIYKSFESARNILNNVNLLNDKHNTVFMEYENTLHNRISLLNKRELLMKAFESGDAKYTQLIINEFFEKIKQSGYFNIVDAQKLLTEFLLIIEDILLHLELDNCHAIYSILEEYTTSSPNLNFEDIERVVNRTVDILLKSIQTNRITAEKANIYSIKNYIDEYYYKEIKLNTFENKYFFSKAYLSKLFKEEFECGIYEYVLNVRMDKATELLQKTQLSIQTISEKVGYSDSNYFSKAFKKFNGIAPSQLRSNV